MNVIAFDLEMNRYNTEYCFEYHGAQQSLRGEIVQIGAAKLDETGNVVDTFTLNLRPRIFKRLSPFVAKVTGITQQQLENGVPIRDGLKQFVNWCGENTVLIEWGMDDVPVLKQNLVLNGLSEDWPIRYYDLQQIFARQFPLGEGDQLNLEAVITRLGLPMERDYHNALADALYTADICRCLDFKKGFADYPSETQQMYSALCSAQGATYCGFAEYGPFFEREAWNDAHRIPQSVCPLCGKALQADKDDIWVYRGKNRRHSVQTCLEHGKWLTREKSVQWDGLHWNFARVFEHADEKILKRFETERQRILKQRNDNAQQQSRT